LTPCTASAQQEAYGLQGPSAYAYTSKAKCLDVDGIDDVADWAETLRAMQTIGLGQAEIDSILRMLALILWLGNVTFTEGSDGNAAIADPSVPDFVAYLMDAAGGSAAVVKALTLRTMETTRGGRRGSVYEVPMNPAQASSARDALSKAIYNNLFECALRFDVAPRGSAYMVHTGIVARVNISLKSRSAAAHVVGILDIYGFEIFDSTGGTLWLVAAELSLLQTTASSSCASTMCVIFRTIRGASTDVFQVNEKLQRAQ
jgi:myosin-1